MSRIQVKDLKDGDTVKLQTFFISDMQEMKKKDGNKYASFKVGDKSGSIAARCWDYGNYSQSVKDMFKNGALLDLSGKISTYNGTLQIITSGIQEATTTDMSEFERVSKFDPNEMHRNFVGYIDCFDHLWFRVLARAIHDKYSELFHTKPAATVMHHAFKHGLLEHTFQMLMTADKLFELPFYADALNKDLCMFGIMFHDYGKIFEYGDGPGYEITVSGQKCNHIVRMTQEIGIEATKLEIPRTIIDDMTSIIASHHGRVAHGSPQTPSTPEAIFVHFIDNLHGSVFGAIQKIEGDTSASLSVKYGFNEDAYYLPKKRFSETLKEEELKHGTGNNTFENTGKFAEQKDDLGGFDPELQRFLLMFEDRTILSIDSESIEVPSDVAETLKSFLDEHGAHSKQVVALDGIVNPPAVKETPVEEILPIDKTELTKDDIREAMFDALTKVRQHEGPMAVLTKEAVLGRAETFKSVVTTVITMENIDDAPPVHTTGFVAPAETIHINETVAGQAIDHIDVKVAVDPKGE